MRRSFCWIPYFPSRFLLKIHNFFNHLTNRFDWFIGAVRIQHYFFSDFGEHSLFRSYLPHPNLELCTDFFCWSPYFSGNIISKFHNFPLPARLVGIRFNQLSGQLMWSADFCDFRAQIPYGSCPYALDRSWAVFWVHFGLCLKLHAAHHESMWILGGEASSKLRIVSLHGK